MSIHRVDRLLEQIGESLEIPDSGYETARKRYDDLSAWFGRPEASCSLYSPHIYSQGSFRLGTVVRPVSDDGTYDLDMGCRLRVGVSKASHTQEQLKKLVGQDLERYRIARRIQQKLEEKHRCWRLEYADTLQFHMDTVPSIPETESARLLIEKELTLKGTQRDLANRVAALTGAITDNRTWNYRTIHPGWRVSNSEGYALWFESRMRLAESLLHERALAMKLHKVDEIPVYRWKSPLQRVVQILKRHRDVLYASNAESQPISVIITTLAGGAYGGERTVAEALRNVLARMGSLVNKSAPRVANPVNPAEDFADKWADPSCAHLRLEDHFWRWLRQAQADLSIWENTNDIHNLAESVNKSVGTRFAERDLGAKLGMITAGGLLRPAVTPTELTFPNKPLVPSKPAGFA